MSPDGFRGVFRTDDLARAIYSEGAGISREIPEAVAVPSDADDVASLVRWAGRAGNTLIPRGSASGMAGGAVGPGVVVDLSRLQKIGAVDTRSKSVFCEAGVICKTADDAARAHGLRFPVDPSSAAFCTVGGMAATNAAGPHSLKFGSMRKWAAALDCVFSDGSRAVVRRGEKPPDVGPVKRFLSAADGIRGNWKAAEPDHAGVRKDSSGYALRDYFGSGELVDLIVGSEGTLAVIVGVELALAPVPQRTSSLLAAFPSLDGATRGASLAREMGAAACELLDQTFLAIAALAPEASAFLRDAAAGTGAVLLVEMESDEPDGTRGKIETLRSALKGAGAETVDVALTPDSEKLLWDLRHAASPILSRLTDRTSMQFIEDGAVPAERLGDYVSGVRAALDRHHVGGVVFGHAGDAHVHVNPLIETSKPDWCETLTGLLEDVVTLTARLGGTLTGEHGDGRLRTPLLPRVWSPAAMECFTGVKEAFDPRRILNEGVKVCRWGTAPVGDIKYDVRLSPLPEKTRAALDDIVARRDYARFRLSLID